MFVALIIARTDGIDQCARMIFRAIQPDAALNAVGISIMEPMDLAVEYITLTCSAIYFPKELYIPPNIPVVDLLAKPR